MRFLCFMCPTIMVLYIVKFKNSDNSLLNQLKLYLVSLPVVNVLSCLLFYLFSDSSKSVWNRVEGNMLLSIKYIVASYVVAILWGLFLECLRQRLSFKITIKDKQVKLNEKEKDNR